MDNSELEQQAQQLYADAKPAPALRDRTLKALPPPSGRPPYRLLLALAGTAAVVGIVAGIVLVPHPASALAPVEKALRRVNTASWDSTLRAWDEKKDTQRMVSHHTLRINPPAIRIETTVDSAGVNEGVFVWTPEGSWCYDSKQDAYLIFEGSTSAAPAEVLRMRKANQKRILDPVTNTQGLTWTRQPRVRQGRPTLQFSAQSHRSISLYTGKGGTVRRNDTVFLWADPKTHLLIREEREYHWWKTGMLQVSANFRYDQPIPPGTFAPRPPAGARCFVSADLSKAPTSLPESELPALRAAIARIERAWAQRDSAALAAEFDFAYLPTLYANPGSSYSLHPFAEQQKSYWQKRLQALSKRFPTTDIQHWELTSAKRVGALSTSAAPLLYRPVGEPEWIKAEVEARTAGGMHVHRLFFRTLPDGTPRLFFVQLAEVQEGFPDPPGVFGK
ncbi:hypothetical protein [Armatimonas rosea]|uniref:Uncharacterized protein n=1 Tax=Armatimonas rosea TaxID=685828 RepID=A0A7W9SUR0_ARMRO|nr:hypothetical protein [Armatimonas rosea]MBB6052408.1 hypothetical protein [Armatimonas rosea]